MISFGYYLVNEENDELWEVEYDKSNYKTSDIPSIRKSTLSIKDVIKYNYKIKTFKEVVSLIPYPQLP